MVLVHYEGFVNDIRVDTLIGVGGVGGGYVSGQNAFGVTLTMPLIIADEIHWKDDHKWFCPYGTTKYR